ncbi:MAG: hypothetical protein GY866_06565 [Proteobacteria bacterium]|nr:hypothetical protein [Pseudomonadota bacterium]
MDLKKLTEKDLYLPVKKLFEEKGYTVKGEVNHCDLVAQSEGKPLVLVELKKNLNLELFLQVTDRLTITDQVYLAFPLPKANQKNSIWNRKRSSVLRLCRRVGVGIIGVHIQRVIKPFAEIHLVPGPYNPRKSAAKTGALMKEFDQREGDHNLGGSSSKPLVTAYRQEALRCAQLLKMHGALKISILKQLGAGEKAGNILRDNHYHWFGRKERGVYQITSAGLQGLSDFKWVVDSIEIKPE